METSERYSAAVPDWDELSKRIPQKLLVGQSNSINKNLIGGSNSVLLRQESLSTDVGHHIVLINSVTAHPEPTN
jgi:hypothetical protein